MAVVRSSGSRLSFSRRTLLEIPIEAQGGVAPALAGVEQHQPLAGQLQGRIGLQGLLQVFGGPV